MEAELTKTRLQEYFKEITQRLHDNEEGLLTGEKLTVEELRDLYMEQSQLQSCAMWIENIFKHRFPSKIVAPSNGRQ